MIKLKNILAEEVYGNKATVYHRTETRELLRIILNDEFIYSNGMYGEGIYTTYEPTKKTDWKAPNPKTGDPAKDNPEGRYNYANYGPFQVKFSVDLINFFIFDWDVYKTVKHHIAKVEKFTKQKSDINNFINLQAEYFKLPYKINTPYKKRYTSNLAQKFGFGEDYKYSDNSLINGIIFFGSRDGNVLVCYNTDLLIPIHITNSDTNETINLQKLLDSNMQLQNKFKKYFKKFVNSKDTAMNFKEKNLYQLAKQKWNYNKKTKLFSFDGNVEITEEFIIDGRLLIHFDKVGGNFDIHGFDELESLVGSPKVVGGNFNCSNTIIRTLEGAPVDVGGDFNCSNTRIGSLKGTPTNIIGKFDCHGCDYLKSLDGAPLKVGGDFACFGCSQLKSLQGAPQEVGGNFNCFLCFILKSLEGSPKEIGGNFSCSRCNNLESLEYLPKAKKYTVPDHLKDELERILKERGEIK